MPDGRLNLVARGTRPFRIEARQDELAYPAGTVEFLFDREEDVDPAAAAGAHAAYTNLVEQATDRMPEPDEIAAMSAYEMAATVEFGLDAKQGLLDLRSETARMKLVARLFRAAIKRLDFIDRAQARARSNGKVHFTAEQGSEGLAGRQRARPAPFGVGPSGVRAVVEQQPRQLRVVVVGGGVQRREAALLADVGFAPASSSARTDAWSPTAAAECSGCTPNVFSASASGFAPVARIALTASGPPKKAARCSGVKPSPPRRLRSAPRSLVDVAQRRGLERADLGTGREQRVARIRPAVIEREQQRRDPVLVARGRELGLLPQQGGQVVRRDGCHEVHLGSVAMLPNSEIEALADRLHSAAIRPLRGVRREDAAAGLPPAQLSALAVVVFGGPLTLGRLAEAEQVRSPTMSRIVSALERAALVTRSPHPDDARSTLIAATPAGRTLLLEGRRRRVSVLEARSATAG